MPTSTPVKLERFIPFTKHDLLRMLVADGPIDAAQKNDFTELSRILISLYHQQFHTVLEALKRSYHAYNPDRDTHLIYKNDEEKPFHQHLNDLLIAANYSPISEKALNEALNNESLFKIRLFVNFDDFEESLLYARGISEKTETIKTFFGLRKKTIKFINYDRVVLFLRFKGKDEKILKLFRNVPKADLEMLFPNTEVRMRLTDKLMIGLPAAVSGGIIVTTKLGGTFLLIGGVIGFWLGWRNQPVVIDQAALIGLAASIGALGTYLWKQFSNFKNRKMRFLKTLTENLYFKNLDNNAGVFHRILDAAEEEECKEALLAYAFLLNEHSPISKQILDQRIEAWFKEQWDCQLDFEIEDALQKLQKLEMITTNDAGYSAIPIKDGINQLRDQWIKLQ